MDDGGGGIGISGLDEREVELEAWKRRNIYTTSTIFSYLAILASYTLFSTLTLQTFICIMSHTFLIVCIYISFINEEVFHLVDIRYVGI